MPAPRPEDAFLTLDDDGQPYSVMYGKCFTHNIILLIEHAMRIAAASEGAPARCRKKACRSSDTCHLKMNLDGDGYCGAGITQSMQDKAVLMLHFLAHVGMTAREGDGTDRQAARPKRGPSVPAGRNAGRPIA
jgi:hypothetical protein